MTLKEIKLISKLGEVFRQYEVLTPFFKKKKKKPSKEKKKARKSQKSSRRKNR